MSANIIFMGTPEFAVPTLEKLNREFGVKAVVTVPDKPKGRGQKLMHSPVKAKAIELNIPVLQPSNLKDPEFINELESFNPDIMCVLAFRILPESVFSLSKIATFNIHGSLLPKYRGAAPINRAIMNGEKKSGLTSFILKKEVDTGDILFKEEIEISSDWTAGKLHDELMPMAADLSIKTCKCLLEENFKAIKQNDTEATPAPKIFREDCEIKWEEDSITVYNHIRGLSPYPASWTILEGKVIKILNSVINNENGSAGNYQIDDDSFKVFCGSGSIKITELKPEGKKTMKVEDFIRGWRGRNEGKLG